MKRDAQATRQRIFEAATAEFARYGIAGARIDRIAAASGSNKAMIYTYFSSKDGLFDAVVVYAIERHMNAVPLDTRDLPGYAGRVFDSYQRSPELNRMVQWAALERSPESTKVPAVVATYTSKVEAIRQAQHGGIGSCQFPAAMLLELILALIRTSAEFTAAPADVSESELARRRQAIQEAVALLTTVRSAVH